MKNSLRYKHDRLDNPTVKSCETGNHFTEEKVRNYIKPAVGPDNNAWHEGRSNPLGSKGN